MAAILATMTFSTKSKLDKISAAANIDTITLLVFATIASGDQPLDSVLTKVTDKLEASSALGGLELPAQQFNDGPKAVKAQIRQQKAEGIQACKARKLTQRQTTEELRVSKIDCCGFLESGLAVSLAWAETDKGRCLR